MTVFARFAFTSILSLFTSKLWNGQRKLDLLASFSFTIVSWQYLLVNSGTGTKGLTFQRDFHLLIFSWYLLVNGGTGLSSEISFTSVLMIFTRKWWNGRRRLDCLARFSVRIFAYSSAREQSNKKSGTRLKAVNETGERRFFFSRLDARALLAHKTIKPPHFTFFFLVILRKNPTILQSTVKITIDDS